jgi:hypothetical protein
VSLAFAAVVGAGSPDTPFGNLTPKLAGRFALCVALFGASMHYLVSGRKEADLNKMAIGAVLALLSVLLL